MYKQYKLTTVLGWVVWLAAVRPAVGQVTFSRDVAPIVFQHCVQCHHPGGSGPFSLLSFDSARQHATQMALVTRTRAMPPWKVEPGVGAFVGLHPLTDEQIDVFQQWLRDGAREGDRRALPAVPRFNPGWQLGTPDLVVTFAQPYILPSDGPDVSRVFVLPLPVDRLKYIRGFEFRPGNPRVHHANIRIDATEASWQLDQADPAPGYDGIILRSAVYPDGHFLGWTPGQAAPFLPKGLAWRLEPHSYLVVQLHMVPSGKPETIQPSIGLYYTDDPPVRAPVMLRLSVQDIHIPADTSRYPIEDSFTLPVSVDVVALQPHAHYLAREIHGEATLPDGTVKPLIFIRDWDLRWQHVYRLEAPIALPKGTSLSMHYSYDNSAANLRNPHQPPVDVDWGQQSQEEMGDFWVQMVTHNEEDRTVLQAAVERKMVAADVIGDETLIAREPTRVALRNDIAVLYLALGRPVDALRHFQAVLKLTPDSAPAHFNVATTLAAVGRTDEAIGGYREALRIRPVYGQAHNNLGVALLRLDRRDDAGTEFRAAVRDDPSLSEAHLNLGALMRLDGRTVEAIAEFRAAVTTDPDSVSALAGLASLLSTTPEPTLRNPGEAVGLAERAAALTARRDPNVLDVLGAAYAAAGDFDRAVGVATEALELNPPSQLAANIRVRRDQYRQRHPYVSR